MLAQFVDSEGGRVSVSAE